MFSVEYRIDRHPPGLLVPEPVEFSSGGVHGDSQLAIREHGRLKVVLNITDALICQNQGEQTGLLHYSPPR